jgi:hypothetical protein
VGSALGKEDAQRAMLQVTAGMVTLAAVTLVIILVRKRLERERM